MEEVICSRSGLRFPKEGRKTVHPRISYYTSHKNPKTRHVATSVVERGKQEGWDTIERFEQEIEAALNPPPPPPVEYDFCGAWVAKIVGSDPKYRFKREFLAAVETDGRRKRFLFPKEGSHFIETCYQSAKGNETRHYYYVVDGIAEEIPLSRLEKEFPVSSQPQGPSIENCTLFEGRIGAEGEIVKLDNHYWVVVRVDAIHHWEDEDGICGTGTYRGSATVVHSYTTQTSYARPATTEEIKTFQSCQQRQQAIAEAKARLQEIYKSITTANGAAIRPETASYPKGVSVCLEKGYYQCNRILVVDDGNRVWSLTYNGRDGDNWQINNVAGSYVGWYLESAELANEVRQLATIV